MPGYDRTGPMGKGPMTGGQRGLCSGRRSAEEVAALSSQERGHRRRDGGCCHHGSHHREESVMSAETISAGAPSLEEQMQQLRTEIAELKAALVSKQAE